MLTNVLYKFFKNHVSLVILCCASAGFLLSTLLAKALKDDIFFNEWSVLITFLSIQGMFSLLGTEHVAIRKSKIDGKKVELPRECVYICIACAFFSSILVSTVFSLSFSFFASYIPISLLVSFSIIFSNTLRISGKYSLAQFGLGFWKILLCIFILFFDSASGAVVLSLLISNCLLIYIFWKADIKINLISISGVESSLYIGFILSLISIVLLSNIDRFMVDMVLGISEFSNYVLIVTLIIMPFSILSSYVGFREVPQLKRIYNKKIFWRESALLAMITICLFSVWFFAVSNIATFFNFRIDLAFFIPFLTIVLSRMLYVKFSSLVGLYGSKNTINFVNVLSLICLAVVWFGYEGIVSSVFEISLLIGILWFGRLLLFALASRNIGEVHEI